MVSMLVSGSSSPGLSRLPGDIVMCFLVRHFTLAVLLFSQVYSWVPANLMLGVTM